MRNTFRRYFPLNVNIYSGKTYSQFVSSLLPVLLFDGTLTTDVTPKMKNLGTGGSFFDATITNVTVNENGMNFNGLTSALTIPIASAIANLTNLEFFFDANPVSTGESGVGVFFRYSLQPTRAGYSTTNILFAVDYVTTDATVQIASLGAGRRLYWYTHNGTSKISEIYVASTQTVTKPTQTPVTGVGDIIFPTADLIFGNNSIGTATFEGIFKKIALFNRQLTALERTNLAAFLA